MVNCGSSGWENPILSKYQLTVTWVSDRKTLLSQWICSENNWVDCPGAWSKPYHYALPASWELHEYNSNAEGWASLLWTMRKIVCFLADTLQLHKVNWTTRKRTSCDTGLRYFHFYPTASSSSQSLLTQYTRLGRLYTLPKARSQEVSNRYCLSALLLRLHTAPRVNRCWHSRVSHCPGTHTIAPIQCKLFSRMGW